MHQKNSTPHFNTDFDPQTGTPIQLAPKITRICAPNTGPYTFTGTNTYLIGEKELIILDPGPNDDQHLKAILTAIGKRPVRAIMLTHTHKDHSSLVPELHKHTGAPLWFEGKHRLSRPRRMFEINLLQGACDWKLTPDRHLKDGDIIEIDGIKLHTITTPGHCANHLCFGVEDTPYLFSGDHVMGWNSTLIATPDGSMAQYFASLEKLANREWRHYFPGHGAPIENKNQHNNAARFANALRVHRAIRNQQILEKISAGATSIKAIVDAIYPHTSTKIRIAAALTVGAHIEYLQEQNRLIVKRGLFSSKIYPMASE